MRKLIKLAASTVFILLLFSVSIYSVTKRDKGFVSLSDVEFAEVATFYDVSSSLTPENLPTISFEPSLSFDAKGYLKGTLWYRLAVEQLGEIPVDKALLQVSIPNLDHVSVYYQDSLGEWVAVHSGDTIPLSERPWASPRLGFVISLDDIDNNYFYLSIKSSGSVGVSLNIGEWSSMQALQSLYHFGGIVFFLLLGGAAFITAFLYYIYSERLFLVFLLCQMAYFLAAFSYSGYLSVLFPFMVTDKISALWIHFATLLTVAFQVLFFRSLHVRVWVRHAQLAIFVAYIILAVGQFFLEQRLTLQLSWCLASVFTFLMLIGVWDIEKNVYVSTWALRSIYTVYALCIFVWLLPVLGVFPVHPYSFFGPTVHGILNISLILAIILKFVENSRLRVEKAQRQVLQVKVEAEVERRMSTLYRDLLLTITHEIGTALSVFKLALSKPDLTGGNKARMVRALNSLEEVLENFIFTERIEAVGFDSQPTVLNLSKIIKDEAKVLSEGEMAGDFRLYFLDGRSVKLRTDEAAIRLVISNILSNAVKYSDPNTKIDVYLSVKDELVSVAVENACSTTVLPDPARVFDRFYRGPKVSDRPGSGLGLYIVLRVLQLLGGSCMFEIIGGNRVRMSVWVPSIK